VVEGEMLQIKVRTKVRISRSGNDKRKREREGIKRSQKGGVTEGLEREGKKEERERIQKIK